MYYSPAMDEIKDFTDLAAAFTGDIRHGFISRVEGSGMEKAGICSGDYLLFSRDREPENGDIVFLEVYGPGKRIVRNSNTCPLHRLSRMRSDWKKVSRLMTSQVEERKV